MSRRRALAGWLVAAVALVAARAPAAEPETFVLPNGLRVVLVVEELPLVHVNVYYPVGPQTEPPGLEGIAHYLEHLMFVSTADHPEGGLASELELLTTHRTASTHGTYTDYRSECIPELLSPFLRLEAERMGALEPSVAELEREKGIVLEEIAYRSHWSPSRQLWVEVFRASFPGHPLGRPIEGTSESMGRVGEVEFRDYRDRFHGPTGAVLVVVGDFDPIVIRGIVEEEFGPIPANPVPVPEIPPLPERPTGVEVELDRFDDIGYVAMLGFRLPSETNHDFVLARVMEELFDDTALRVGLRALPGEYFLTLSGAWGYARTDWDGNESPIDAAADAKRRYPGLWKLIRDRVVSGLEDEPFAELVSETVARYRRVRGNPKWAAELAGRRYILDEQYPPTAVFEEVATALTPDEVNWYIAERVHPTRAVYGVSHGRDSGRLASLPPPSRPSGGEEGAIVSARLLSRERVEPRLESYRKHFSEPIRTGTLANGLTVHTVPVRGATYGLVAGVRTFPPLGDEKKGKKRGLTWAYNRLMRTAIAEKETDDDDRLPPSLSIRASPSDFVFRASSTPPRTEESIRAVYARLQNDRLDVPRWKDVHRWMDSAPRDHRLRSTVRADLRRWESLFDEKSPVMGGLVPETAEGKKLTYKHMQELHKKLRKAEGLQLFVVTDPEHVDCTAALEETFGRGKAKDRKQSDPPETKLAGIRGEVIADFQEKDVELTVSFPPFAVGGDGHPGWAATELSRIVVGQRLISRLREQEGLVYYCFATFQWVGGALLPEIATASRPEDATRVYGLLREELARLAREDLDEAELLRARLSLVKRRARWWSNASTAVSDLVRMARHGELPADPVGALVDAPVVEVQRALGTWLDPERFSFTLVGPLFEEAIAEF